MPEMTAAEMGQCYPGARLIPLPDGAAEAAVIGWGHAALEAGVTA